MMVLDDHDRDQLHIKNDNLGVDWTELDEIEFSNLTIWFIDDFIRVAIKTLLFSFLSLELRRYLNTWF